MKRNTHRLASFQNSLHFLFRRFCHLNSCWLFFPDYFDSNFEWLSDHVFMNSSYIQSTFCFRAFFKRLEQQQYNILIPRGRLVHLSQNNIIKLNERTCLNCFVLSVRGPTDSWECKPFHLLRSGRNKSSMIQLIWVLHSFN